MHALSKLVWSTAIIAATTSSLLAAPVGHAHNDYLHPRPLLDALDAGFGSVEADVHLVNGQLLVAHDRPDAKPDKSLETLYLAPLRTRIEKNGGAVHTGRGEFILLIDFKSAAVPTYDALRPLLEKYSSILTRFFTNKVERGAVTIIISGNRPISVVSAEPTRLVAIDGRTADLTNNVSPFLMPLISDNWSKLFTWRGEGPLPENERTELQRLVRETHRRGSKIRFWAAPDRLEGWQELQQAKVDLLNTDHLAGMAKFLRGLFVEQPLPK